MSLQRNTKAPRLPDPPAGYTQDYMNQLIGVLRTYFTQNDSNISSLATEADTSNALEWLDNFGSPTLQANLQARLAANTYLPLSGGTLTGGLTTTTINATGAITPSTTAGLVGTTLADNAQAGSVGEYLTNSTTSVSLTTAVYATATSISLTPGDWDVWGYVQFAPAGTTTVQALLVGVSTLSTNLSGNGYTQIQASFTTGLAQALNAPMARFNISTTTTIYLLARMNFLVSTATCNGIIYARRVR